MRKKTLRELKEFLDVAREDYSEIGYKDIYDKIDRWRDEIQNELEGLTTTTIKLKKSKG